MLVGTSASRSAPSERSEEGRAFLQRRVAFFGLTMGLLSGAFLALRLVESIASEHVVEEIEHPTMALHGMGTFVLLGMWAILRTGRRSVRFVHAVDAVGLLVSSFAFVAMGFRIPLVMRPDLMIVLILSWTLLGRSIYVPSTWQRTALLGAAVGAALLGMLAWHHRHGDPLFAETVARAVGEAVDPVYLSRGLMVGVMAWWSATVFLSAAASSVTFGLRRAVSEARELGQYVLLHKLGEGGMGEVYEARHSLLRRPTAVKLLHPDRAGERSIARFEREVRSSAHLQHPNTITIFDFGRSADGVFYYAMELLDGGTVSDVVDIDGPQPPERVAWMMYQVADALAEAHAAGLVHRDIKPGNVMLGVRGGVPDMATVVDFGLVKEIDGRAAVGVTDEHAIVGTPLYLAPEAIRFENSRDPRSDLYSLGALAYYMLTGSHVFETDSTVELLGMHLMQEPEPPSQRLGGHVPEDLEALILELLAKDPADRPQTAAALRDRVGALSCYGAWDRARAARWWHDFGPELQAQRGQAKDASRRTVQVDLEQRSPITR
jgi:serine/threonine-protein kinase